jgi:hypothetical protein
VISTASSLTVRVAVLVVKLLKVVSEIITSVSAERGDPDLSEVITSYCEWGVAFLLVLRRYEG